MRLGVAGVRLRAGYLPAFISILLAGCAIKPPLASGPGGPAGGLTPVAFSALPGWNGAAAVTGLASFRQSCRAIAVMPVDQKLGGDGVAGALGGQAGLWRGVCAQARAVAPGDASAAMQFFQRRFVAYRAAGMTRITGDFEPVYAGSEVRLPGYDVPLYGKPRDLVVADQAGFHDRRGHRRHAGRLRGGVMEPYYSRARIAAGAISGKAVAIAWLRDPVDAYMVQVQGAARLRLPDGTLIDLGFDGTNGRGYTPIGKVMVAKGDLATNDVSIQSIGAWLRAHPAQAAGLMDENRNYVFFKRVRGVPAGLGAPGALGVPLTPEASLAVDETAIPLGAPVFVAAAGVHDLAVAQDIDVEAKGASAAQLFIGIGRNAAQVAGGLDEAGQIFVLLPRPVPMAGKATGATS